MTHAPTRRDAARNRERLLDAARSVFARLGPDTPLDEIAAAAGVSRTTLHRHFASREMLASAVLAQNVAEIEARSAALAGADDGAEQLFHHLLDAQLEAPWLARMIAGGTSLGLGELSARTAAAIAPLAERARAAGALRPGVTVDDVLLTLPMAMAAQAAEAYDGNQHPFTRVRALLHQALFTTGPEPYLMRPRES
ncbi:TetR/AcrR family transcriptional regulator [Myceligenerans indicum]|uniref:TetR/AcrR family transcriptional regulator n=1 Tax=Myceligenerans indicum TaxID=2593663 RepID=A0ABS1LK58_9MICO|nr:TetR/AcrR family transcriptional regulator [Myceligenerans indicum]MBL0885962.1 TetR/AcrR family transcriptional regulator [Myceligenerans indicum]